MKGVVLYLVFVAVPCTVILVGIWRLDERRWRRERNERLHAGRCGRPWLDCDADAVSDEGAA